MSETVTTLDFLRALYRPDTPGGLLAYCNEPFERRIGYPSGLAKFARIIADFDQKHNVYQTVNTLDIKAVEARGEYTRGKEDEVVAVVAIVADVDAEGKEKHDYPPQSIIIETLARMPLAPSIVIVSGRTDGGVHPYWLLAEPVVIQGDPELRKRVKSISERWQRLLEQELSPYELDSTFDLVRVLRPIGTTNKKYGTMVEALTFEPDRRYTLEDFERHLPKPEPRIWTPPAFPIDDKMLQRAAAYVQRIPGAVSNKGGHNHTLYVACKLVEGFSLSTAQAMPIMRAWNETCEPPWTEKELQHKLESAMTKIKRPGYMLEPKSNGHNGLDLTTLVGNLARHTSTNGRPHDEDTEAASEIQEGEADSVPLHVDPGTTPSHLLNIPGFVNELTDFCLDVAPYPNRVLAFAGALAMQGHLAGRKIRDASDNRTNLYILALAMPGGGKDMPRKLNMLIADESGLSATIGERFASSEGLEDALVVNPCMLFQNDEFDSMLQAISKSKDGNAERIMGLMLKIYTSAASKFHVRRKAGEEARVIDQPQLTIFGTAVPVYYYRALSERLLSNGFFARTIVLESGPRGKGQEAKIPVLPERIRQIAKDWANRCPGTGNLTEFHPIPDIVHYNPEAEKIGAEFRELADERWQAAADCADTVATAVWGRANETARRLALIYAASENHIAPCVTGAAMQWAAEFVDHHARRMLYMAQEHSADSEFHRMCQAVKERLRAVRDKCLPHWKLLKMAKTDSKTFEEVIRTLTEQQDIQRETVKTGGRSCMRYRLLVP